MCQSLFEEERRREGRRRREGMRGKGGERGEEREGRRGRGGEGGCRTALDASTSDHRWSEKVWVHHYLLSQKAALPGMTLLSFLVSVRSIRLTLVRGRLFATSTSV